MGRAFVPRVPSACHHALRPPPSREGGDMVSQVGTHNTPQLYREVLVVLLRQSAILLGREELHRRLAEQSDAGLEGIRAARVGDAEEAHTILSRLIDRLTREEDSLYSVALHSALLQAYLERRLPIPRADAECEPASHWFG